MSDIITIKKNYEFSRIYKKSKFFVGKFIVLYVISNRFEFNRLGITVSKKFGNSVKRNRIRRLIKENYRNYNSFLNKGYDLVFVARKTEEIATNSEIKKEMKFLLKKLGVYNRENLD